MLVLCIGVSAGLEEALHGLGHRHRGHHTFLLGIAARRRSLP
jgi:hypothetical protein